MPYPQIPDSYIRQAVIQGINFWAHEQWFTWILSSHYDFSEKVQTEIGELVSKAKYKDDASAALKTKKNSSLYIGMELLKNKEVDAFLRMLVD